ncbi:hypothetical protein Pan14r_13570 [Crateriforma conspicua]|uniref:Uncharacterized protein n=1 Tax=Crateriforma conspicua TaxID=2527996 RepID=A0A5C5Y300_9PLAN|nr:hypothetical protein Mal65_28370 [Crateriforma conspicua]TWT69073.1 hypothetical protein Pan14r_13570 [Crateriforma conspicua]
MGVGARTVMGLCEPHGASRGFGWFAGTARPVMALCEPHGASRGFGLVCGNGPPLD